MKICSKHNFDYEKICKECDKENQRKYQVKLRKELQVIANEYKLSKGCNNCGYKENAFALEFDHIIPRDNTGKKWTTPKYKKALRELIADPNIQVLCANCHKIKTRLNNDHLRRTP